MLRVQPCPFETPDGTIRCVVTIETDDVGRVISKRPSRGRRLDTEGRWVDVPQAELDELWRRYS